MYFFKKKVIIKKKPTPKYVIFGIGGYMKQGFIKVAAASPRLRVADCKYNVDNMIKLAKLASEKGVKLLVFPELAITGSTCGDLFFSEVLQNGAVDALKAYLAETADSDMVSVVGLPFRYRDALYNCAAVCQSGEVVRFVPKTNLTEKDSRYFTKTSDDIGCFCFDGHFIAIGTDYIFSCEQIPDFRFGVEIGEDLWAVNAPSDTLALKGATIIANPTATCEEVGKDDYRRLLVKAQSAKTRSGYILANAGYGESSTDYTFSAHSIIAENGDIIAETKPFDIGINSPDGDRLTISEIDVSMLSSERAKNPNGLTAPAYEPVETCFDMSPSDTDLTRKYPALPFVPAKKEGWARAKQILAIQSTALCKRIEAAYASKCVIGISGGLDSTLALLVAARSVDMLGRTRKDIIGITMPCFGTTARTKGNAEILCEELGIEFKTVNIADAVLQHFSDIGHDKDNHNVVFENSQARERTQVLMDIANAENGMVIGTGDMSELALGWATYNGDHMSMYGVNASISKTLVRHLVEYCAAEARENGKKKLAEVLFDILDTPVSPELLPADGNTIKQKTEDIVGPYEIHDFYLYYMLRYGFSPKKLYRLACHTIGDTFSKETLVKWLEVFVRRFFTQQYKRSCVPDGPKVGTVGLSPRGDLKMPSDAVSAL